MKRANERFATVLAEQAQTLKWTSSLIEQIKQDINLIAALLQQQYLTQRQELHEISGCNRDRLQLLLPDRSAEESDSP